MVNIGTGVAPVSIPFYSSRNAALIELKMLYYTTLSLRLHHCELSEVKTQVFTLSDVLACVSIHCADPKQHSNRDFLPKSFDNTLQTCVDTANEYLQGYNAGVGVKGHGFCSLYQCKCAGYTRFLKTFLLSNYFFPKSQYFFIALGQNSILRRNRKWLTARAIFVFMVSFSFYGWSFF